MSNRASNMTASVHSEVHYPTLRHHVQCANRAKEVTLNYPDQWQTYEGFCEWLQAVSAAPRLDIMTLHARLLPTMILL